MVARAVEAGLLRRVADPVDGRRSTLELTELGAGHAERVHRFRREVFDAAMRGWSGREGRSSHACSRPSSRSWADATRKADPSARVTARGGHRVGVFSLTGCAARRGRTMPWRRNARDRRSVRGAGPPPAERHSVGPPGGTAGENRVTEKPRRSRRGPTWRLPAGSGVPGREAPGQCVTWRSLPGVQAAAVGGLAVVAVVELEGVELVDEALAGGADHRELDARRSGRGGRPVPVFRPGAGQRGHRTVAGGDQGIGRVVPGQAQFHVAGGGGGHLGEELVGLAGGHRGFAGDRYDAVGVRLHVHGERPAAVVVLGRDL
ncbi:MarR family winged helix-turn-helix transcriptional regulator [Streptosporangium sp. NPDC002721]|uniref:MarR family winged helix-turn-helix transcriptional regulator n=1 Tax=Streptosporangium sp. NPDC002721 TaxID=3366188 RepID=UPI0036B320DD